jgi:hypothetical protein
VGAQAEWPQLQTMSGWSVAPSQRVLQNLLSVAGAQAQDGWAQRSIFSDMGVAPLRVVELAGGRSAFGYRAATKSCVRKAAFEKVRAILCRQCPEENGMFGSLGNRSNFFIGCVALLGISLAGSHNQLSAQTTAAAPIGSVAWYQVGRTAVNPKTGAGYAYGYYSQIAGLTGSMFSGAPGEETAYFTFKTSEFQLIPVKANGDVNMAIVTPDTFNVYYTASPKHDWSNPDSFTTGVIVGTFTREQFLLYRVWESWGREYVTLDASRDFVFNSVTVNLGKVLPAAFLSSTYSNAPLPALPGGFTAVIGFAGEAVVAASKATPKLNDAPPE